MVRAKEEGNLPLEGHHEVADFVKAISKPRKIVILVQAGAAVDATIKALSAECEVSIFEYIAYSFSDYNE